MPEYFEDGFDPIRPGGASRPVSAMPSADGSSFGSRNTGSGPRLRPGVADPEGYRDNEPSGRHGAPGAGQPSAGINSAAHQPAPAYPSGDYPSGAYPAATPAAAHQAAAHQAAAHQAAAHQAPQYPAPQYPADTPGDRTGARPSGRSPQNPSARPGPAPGRPGGAGATGAAAGPAAGAVTGLGASGPSARATASVAPPVVPGRQGVRKPAVPGRAGAMADSPSGVIQRPGETTGRSPNRGTGRVPRPGGGQPRTGMAPDPEAGGRSRAGLNPDHAPSARVSPGAVDDSPSGWVRPSGVDQQRPGRGRPEQGTTGAVAGRARAGTAAVPSDSGVVTGAASAGHGALGLAPGQVAPGRARPSGAPDPGYGADDLGYGADDPGYGVGDPGYGAGDPGYGADDPGYRVDDPGYGADDPGHRADPGYETGQPGYGARVSGVVAASAVPVPSNFDDLAGTGDGPARGGGRTGAVAGSPIRPAAGDQAAEDNVGGFKGARSELRRQMRAKRRLRVVTLVSLSVVVLGLLPLLFGIRAATRDPVFTSIDALDVPGWAAIGIKDQSSGSRWCFLECRFRERTAQSQRPFAPTGKVYSTALVEAGWQRWKVGGCPDQPIRPEDGVYTCWRRDEFTLDLWVRLPECAVDARAAQDPAAIPSIGANGLAPTADPKTCVGSTVSIKVQNAITDTRGKTDNEKPGLTGETPDPVLSNDPLLPTPSPS